MIAVNLGMIKDQGGVEASEIAMAYQNFIICGEMVLASVGLYKGFHYSEYMDGGLHAGAVAEGEDRPKSSVIKNLKNVSSARRPCGITVTVADSPQFTGNGGFRSLGVVLIVQSPPPLRASRPRTGTQTLNPSDVIQDTVRNFSKKYKKYARSSLDGDSAVDNADSDEDTDTEQDVTSAGDIKKAKKKNKKRGKAKGYAKMGLPDMEDVDEEGNKVDSMA